MNILVGYDGSNVAREALELVKKRAKVWGAKIDVVNCMAQNRELEYEDIRPVRHLTCPLSGGFNKMNICRRMASMRVSNKPQCCNVRVTVAEKPGHPRIP